jgi:opacity protein-like surface antigen
MRRIFPLGLVLLIVANSVFAQDAGATVNRANQKGLLFTLAGLGDFGVTGNLLGVAVPTSTASSQKLAGLGLKYYLSPKLAVRGSIHLGLVQTESQLTTGTKKTTVSTIGFAPGVEYHFVNTKAVTAYFGGAAAFGLFNTSVPADPDSEGSGYKFKGMVYSLALLFGVEFFLADNLSLGAEYQLGANYTSGKSEYGPNSYDLPKTLNLGISALAATLAVYW